MFQRIFIRPNLLIQNSNYLINFHQSSKLLRNNFSRISRNTETKGKTVGRKVNNNNGNHSSSNGRGNKGQSDKEPPKQSEKSFICQFENWKTSEVLISTFMLYGLAEIMFLKKKVANIPTVSYEEFEQDYLLRGEVQFVNVFSPFVYSIIGVSAEVFLHPDKDRSYQKIAISTNVPVLARIKATEKNMKISSQEAVQFGYIIPDIFFLVGILLYVKKYGFLTFKNFETFMKDFVNRVKKTGIEGLKSTNRKYMSFKEALKKFKKRFEQFDMFDSAAKSEVQLRPTTVTTNIKFKDIAGLHSAKIEINEFLDYLNKPSKFIQLGARLPKGALLLGPPGCGKTLLVKALANESKVPFYYRAGSDFVNLIGGVGAKHIRRLFMFAKEKAPAIIFIDEIDAIGKKRSGTSSGQRDFDQTLIQLLVEMDGMNSVSGIIVFAATNRADILDSALVRPGRFDRHILIDLPVLEERKEIFELYLSKYKKITTPVDVLKDKLALQTPGMTGADIRNLCNEAAIVAAKFNYPQITDNCFEMALERIIAGAAKQTNALTKEERQIVAFHEAGHVIVGWFLKYADPLIKVSIVPRTNNALGYSQRDNLERYLATREYLYDRIAVLLGGRAAESICCNQITSGAHDDLKKVRKIAFHMIREWGMSEKVGHLSFRITEKEDAYDALPYSYGTKALIEAEASNIISCGYKRAEEVLEENFDKLELLARELLKREVLSSDDIEKLIGPRPHHV